MRTIQPALITVAVFQGLSTLVGAVELLVAPEWFAPMLNQTVFAGQYALAAVLLGLVVGGFQWTAVIVHLRLPSRLPLGHTLSGVVMIGWIFGECLVLNSFMWPHALWGGIGVVQLLLVLILLGVLRPSPDGGTPAPLP